MPEPSLEDTFLAVLTVLEDARVPNALCGGIAANLYRERVRATEDVDVYLICAAPKLVTLARQLEEAGWQAHPASGETELLRLKRKGHAPVDLLIASTDFERSAVERAATFRIGGKNARVLLPEDLIVFKLAAGREHDYEAVGAILHAQGEDLDAEFIEGTLTDLDMEDRWTRALGAAARMSEEPG